MTAPGPAPGRALTRDRRGATLTPSRSPRAPTPPPPPPTPARAPASRSSSPRWPTRSAGRRRLRGTEDDGDDDQADVQDLERLRALPEQSQAHDRCPALPPAG